MHVIIVGAGLTGLLIAQGLKKNGISFSIYEKSRGSRSRNWGVTLHWAAEHWDDLLPDSLKKRLVDGQVDRMQDGETMHTWEEIALRNGQTGERYCTIPFPGVREYNVGRLKVLLSEGIDINYGKVFSHMHIIGDLVSAEFEDGSRATGTVVVGTDGNSSRIRRCVLEPVTLSEPESLPYNMINVTTTYTAEQALFIRDRIHPVVDIGVHPKGMYFRLNVLDIRDHEKPETWEFQLLATWPLSEEVQSSNAEERLQNFRVLAKDWAEPHQSAVEWLPETVKVYNDYLRDWIPRRWDNHGGKLTMAGDAAHTMTFHLGQGANNAVRDAAMFTNAMKRVHSGEISLINAVTEYEAEIFKRGQRAVTLSRKQTYATHQWGELTGALEKAGGVNASIIV